MKRKLVLLMLLLGTLLAACGGNDADTREPSIALEECRLTGGVMARCGVLTVAENPDAPDGRAIGLDIAVLPATGSSNVVQADPLFLLAGGPGQSATEAYPLAAYLFEEVNRTCDIVLIDQRGTGEEGGFTCENLTDESLPDDLPDAAAVALLDECRDVYKRQGETHLWRLRGEPVDALPYLTDCFHAVSYTHLTPVSGSTRMISGGAPGVSGLLSSNRTRRTRWACLLYTSATWPRRRRPAPVAWLSARGRWAGSRNRRPGEQ